MEKLFVLLIWKIIGTKYHFFAAHIRRTDKSKEANPIDTQFYMQEITDYFDILISEGKNVQPKVLITTDEPKVIDEIQSLVDLIS